MPRYPSVQASLLTFFHRGLVSRFPLTFALVASTVFFSLSVVVLAACILPALQWPVPMNQTPDVSEPREDRPVRVRKRPRRNVAGESRVTSTVRSSHICFAILGHNIYRATNPRIFPSIFLQPWHRMAFLSSDDVHACLMFP